MSIPKQLAPTTQTRHPWRAVARTVFAAVIALLSLLPTIAAAAGIEAVPLVAQALAVAAAVTRVLAIPGVDDFLRRYLPFLASAPAGEAPPPPRREPGSTLFRGDGFADPRLEGGRPGSATFLLSGALHAARRAGEPDDVPDTRVPSVLDDRSVSGQ
ncbi:hypothetical protein Q3V37_17910 [Micromonospora profundi]|uniref:Uncharacterized protein n=1 Tax=Micromonospora profundi TaxID=1420889 RepID=A0AAJ6HS46_9ACTN|nr:hypothetical protein [Micromonospora profundi]WLS43294.1 hypothetical protein Q3V37_17910 [Micromonospora profundi]